MWTALQAPAIGTPTKVHLSDGGVCRVSSGGRICVHDPRDVLAASANGWTLIATTPSFPGGEHDGNFFDPIYGPLAWGTTQLPGSNYLRSPNGAAAAGRVVYGVTLDSTGAAVIPSASVVAALEAGYVPVTLYWVTLKAPVGVAAGKVYSWDGDATTTVQSNLALAAPSTQVQAMLAAGWARVFPAIMDVA
jgi:hypothetical protein